MRAFLRIKLTRRDLRTPAHDYAAAQCLLQNGLLAGLVLGTQSIEKILSAVTRRQSCMALKVS